jgi:hypothetical protein
MIWQPAWNERYASIKLPDGGESHKPHYVKLRLAPERYDDCLKSVLHRDVPVGRAGSSPSSAKTAAISCVTVLFPEGRSRK